MKKLKTAQDALQAQETALDQFFNTMKLISRECDSLKDPETDDDFCNVYEIEANFQLSFEFFEVWGHFPADFMESSDEILAGIPISTMTQ